MYPLTPPNGSVGSQSGMIVDPLLGDMPDMGSIPEDPIAQDLESNGLITAKVNMVPYGLNTDHKTIHLETGDSIFVQLESDPEHVTSNVLTVGQLNRLLRSNADFLNALNLTSELGQRYARFKELLVKHGEGVLSAYHLERSKQFPAVRISELYGESDEDQEELSELKEFYSLAISKEFYVMTKVGILANWAFAGIFSNLSMGKRNGLGRRHHGSHTDVGVYVAKGRSEKTINLWGDRKAVPSQTMLFFVLKRALDEVSRGARLPHMVIEPFANPRCRYVPSSVLSYKTGNETVFGHAWCVGKVDDHYPGTMEEPNRVSAAGLLSSSAQQIMESAAHLPRMRIYVAQK